MSRIWILGEAIMDFVPAVSDLGPAFAPRNGGSPFNAAKAAALAGGEAVFLGALSTDMFGDALLAELQAHGLDTRFTPRTEAPSTLAFVQFEDGAPRYAFFLDGTATGEMKPDATGFEGRPGDILHVGSVALVAQPAAQRIASFGSTMAGDLLLSIDPNARPTITNDPDDWRARVMMLCKKAGVIKISDEDLAYLAPGAAPEAFASAQLEAGTGLVVVTYGADGAEAFTSSARVKRPGRTIELADAVGAGDTVTGFLLAELAARGHTTAAAIGGMGEAALASLLDLTLAAAAINCTRVGCNPPTRAEAEAYVKTGILPR